MKTKRLNLLAKKKISILNFIIEVLKWTKTWKKEEYLGEILEELEEDLSSLKLTIKEQDKEIEQYIRLVKATKIEYQNLFEENKQLKENQKNKEQQQQQKEELEK